VKPAEKIAMMSAHPLWLHCCQLIFEGGLRTIEIAPFVINMSSNNNLRELLVGTPEPDAVIVSLDMPSVTLNQVRTLRALGYRGPIMILCSCYTLPNLDEMSEVGVRSIVSSLASLENLRTALYNMLDSRAQPLLQQYLYAGRTTSQDSRRQSLNEHERVILTLVAQDMTDQEVAERIHISVRTVSNHLRYIYAKLGVKSRAGAVTTAILKGLIDPRFSNEVD
jgi:DNA-binding NarL/FixJ family response regulator